MILIFTSENDLSTLEVAKWLNYYKKEFYIINPDEGIFQFLTINNSGIYFKNEFTDKEINLLDAKSCWWRRTGLGIKNFAAHDLPGELTIDDHNLSELVRGNKSVLNAEFQDLREYIFTTVYNNCSINIGSPKMFGLNRLLTVDLAKKHGLKVPEYEVVSNTKQIKSSTAISDRFVTKGISNGIYHLINNKSYYTYTELHTKQDLINEDINVFPSLIMNLVEKKYEIRSFFLDGRFFSMAIFSQSNDQTKIDFRKYSSLKPNKNEPFKLPIEVEEKLDLVFKDLNLNCGSVDLILDTNNEFVFLEINPVGQYGMTSEPCNYNLDKLIANYLINGRLHS